MKLQQKTDVGRVRSSNQDAMTAISLNEQTVFAAVCDGMGGANGGNVASTLCIQTIEKRIQTDYCVDLDDEAVKMLLRESITEANEKIYQHARENPELQGMGTTAVMALVSGTKAILANVGDSRAILFRSHAATQLTKDHSYVQTLVDSGKITAEAANSHPKKNIITRAVGVHGEIEVDLFEYEVQAEDLLLLCSDGLTNELNYEEMCDILKNVPHECYAAKLVEQAIEAGGHDNCTAVFIEI